jgi:hypothetical protein
MESFFHFGISAITEPSHGIILLLWDFAIAEPSHGIILHFGISAITEPSHGIILLLYAFGYHGVFSWNHSFTFVSHKHGFS